MPKLYTNNTEIPFIMEVWLASNDGYDLIPEPYKISATTTMKSAKSIILTQQLLQKGKISLTDISELTASRIGTALHSAVEHSWLMNYRQGMENMGYPKKVIEMVSLNPEDPDPDRYNIWMEKRSERKIGKFTVSGKFDIVENGVVRDIKSTKVWNYQSGINDEKYALQGSIYRWLNPDIITESYMYVDYILTDWKATENYKKDYPSSPIMKRKLALMPEAEIEALLSEKLAYLEDHMDSPESKLPACTPEEVWQRPNKWAFFSKPTNKVPQKVVSSEEEATQLNAAKNFQGKIEFRPGEVKYCSWCPAKSVCLQAERYRQQGLLK